MKGVWGGLFIRFLASAIVCALISTATVGVLTLDTGLAVAAKGMGMFMNGRRHHLAAECKNEPARWKQEEAGFQMYAYDDVNGTSANPNAWPLDPKLFDTVKRGQNGAGRYFWLNGQRGGAMVLRAAETGPCSLVQVTWKLDPRLRAQIMWTFFVSGFLSLAVAIGVTALISIRPLLRRLSIAAKAAKNVGNPNTYRSVPDARGDAIAQLFSALDGAHERIVKDEKELVRSQNAVLEYLSNVAHDLRTPIGSLHLALEELGALNPGTDTSNRAILQLALDEVTYLGALTVNLHLACQLREGVDPLQGSRAELGGIVDRVVARNALLGRQRTIEVSGGRPDDGIWVQCVPSMAEQVVSNLVRNAVVHGEPGGNVAVMLTSPTPGRFELMVLDDGPGVAPDELPRLDERHFRGARTRKGDVEGSGLGLAIVGEICHRAGWRVTFEQQEPRGLKVIIRGEISLPPS